MPLTGKRNNQSVLDKDASIYQIQEEESEKQKWSKLNTRQRLKYFQDYYLLKFLIGILAVIIVVSVIWTTLKPRDENTLSIAVVKNYLIPEGKKALEQQLEELLITGEHQKINIDDTFPDGYETDAKLSVYLSAQEIDLIITNEEHFKELAQRGCFEDLSTYVPDFAHGHAQQLYWTSGISQADNVVETDADFDTDTAGNSGSGNIQKNANRDDVKAYGVRITDCVPFKNTWYADTEAVAGIVINSLHKENADSALNLFFAL